MWGGVLVALRMSMWNSYLFECIWNLFLTGIYAQTFHRVTVVCSRHHWSLLYVTDIIGHCCICPTSLVTVVYDRYHWSLLYMTDIIGHCCTWPTLLVTVLYDRHHWSLPASWVWGATMPEYCAYLSPKSCLWRKYRIVCDVSFTLPCLKKA